jgi:hypothetical protein
MRRGVDDTFLCSFEIGSSRHLLGTPMVLDAFGGFFLANLITCGIALQVGTAVGSMSCHGI